MGGNSGLARLRAGGDIGIGRRYIGNTVRVHRGHPEVGVAGLVVGNRLEVHVHFAFRGFHPEAW